ncbi:hypothetical protein H6P81_006660 [Aristolochia fimbriata]|uniref:Uncharacterized protein n=1 Tax=Aristolochia fimbriata TaxID=158543 RepID=A0AAV7EZ65_ARIFI|nr:hypothetical protein H6P81_006660 [Aristolochia fimbriata]
MTRCVEALQGPVEEIWPCLRLWRQERQGKLHGIFVWSADDSREMGSDMSEEHKLLSPEVIKLLWTRWYVLVTFNIFYL